MACVKIILNRHGLAVVGDLDSGSTTPFTVSRADQDRCDVYNPLDIETTLKMWEAGLLTANQIRREIGFL